MTMSDRPAASFRGRPAVSPRSAGTAVGLVLAFAFALALGGCAGAKVTDTSPTMVAASFSASSSQSEATQRAEIRLDFDQPVTVDQNVLDDFELLVNGAAPDPSTVAVEARGDATGITIAMRPSPEAKGVGAGAYFALYQADVSLASKDAGGALPSIRGADGSAAVMADVVRGVFPSGAVLEVTDQTAGDAAAGRCAAATFVITSPATIRAITWFSPDGGQTKVLKHNHTFASQTAQEFAADLAKAVNSCSGAGVVATARGDEVTLRASSPVDGQVLEPIFVEGIGQTTGAFDASDAEGFR